MLPLIPGWSHSSSSPNSDSLLSVCFLHMNLTTSRVLVVSVSGIVVKVPSIMYTRKKSCEKSGLFWYRIDSVVCSVEIHSSHTCMWGMWGVRSGVT